jgi:hypothetical protein
LQCASVTLLLLLLLLLPPALVLLLLLLLNAATAATTAVVAASVFTLTAAADEGTAAEFGVKASAFQPRQHALFLLLMPTGVSTALAISMVGRVLGALGVHVRRSRHIRDCIEWQTREMKALCASQRLLIRGMTSATVKW